MSGSHTTVARELARYSLDLVGVEEVRWEKGGTLSAGDYTFYMEKETKIINREQDILYNRNLYQQLKESRVFLMKGCYILF